MSRSNINNGLKAKDSNKVSNHTAIPNWSGYIYQGLCAAYVALRLCVEHPDKAQKYYLSLDSYEDFAILDENKKIIELHQCKCFGAHSCLNFTEECKHMRIRKDEYVKEGKCDANAPMYFHCNKKPKIDDDITLYVYHDDKKELQPNDIESKMASLIDQYNDVRRVLVAGTLLTRRLYYWIDQTVLEMHRYFIDHPKECAADKAKEITVEINDLFKCLKSDGSCDLLTKEEAASYVRLYYIRKMHDEIVRIEVMNKPINHELVDRFISILAQYPKEKLWNLFVRFNPHHKSVEVKDVANFLGDNTKPLLKVINNVHEKIEDNLYWHKDDEYESPATFSCHGDADEICYAIIQNKANLDVLFNYRWLVADSDETVDNLYSKVQDVTKVKDGDEKEAMSIFNPQNIGILRIDDKNGRLY